ncbi:MAG: radical SAM protein [Deltaproteobacteria bacterium]|nr:radical SAM protein [Deltaproteobacteria bacterium]
MIRARDVLEAAKMARYAASFLRKRLVHVNLQLLYDCPMRCRICDFWTDRYRDEPALTARQVETISENLARIGPQIVSIGGGEPLLHPQIVDVVRALGSRHFPVMICNGWFVTPAIARAVFSAGAYEVSVSVDYADPRRHDSQRGVEGAHRRALDALNILNQARSGPWQRVHMITVVMDDNLEEIEPLIRLCRSMGITYLVTLYSDSRGSKETRAVPRDVSARLVALKRRHPEFVALRGYLGKFSESVGSGGIGPCFAGRNLCNIDNRGNVALCIDRMDEPVGNILADDPLVIEERLLSKHESNTCRACWTSCRGSIETLMYGGGAPANLLDYYRMTRPVAIA